MGKDNQRLDSWKEIADYLGREVRTAIRWENERGLPVRRVPGGIRQGVFAFTSELDGWRSAQENGSDAGAKSTSPAHASSDLQLESVQTVVPLQIDPATPTVRYTGARSRITWITAGSILLAVTYLAFTRLPQRTLTETPEMTFTRTDYPAAGPAQIFAADINGDGKLDLIFSDYEINSITFLPGNGDGTFGARIDSPAGKNPEFFALADFNHDHKLDIAVGDRLKGVSILLGDGKGAFVRSSVLKISGSPRAVSDGDFNEDGNLDLAVSVVNSDLISIFLGDGRGSFATKGKYALGIDSVLDNLSLVIADTDGDGKLDIIPGNTLWTTKDISVLLGKGDGSFHKKLIHTGQTAITVAVGDLNGDGILDFVTSNPDNTLSVFLGKGNGNFSQFSSLQTGSGLSRVSISDLNEDGKLDLFSLNLYFDRVSIFLGNGNGTFRPKIDVAVSKYPTTVAVGDFNGDGKLDFATAGYGGRSVSVLLNTSRGISSNSQGGNR